MDLVSGAKRVIVAMQHAAKGKSKIVQKCALPLTSSRPVDLVVTDMAVISFRRRKDNAPGDRAGRQRCRGDGRDGGGPVRPRQRSGNEDLMKDVLALRVDPGMSRYPALTATAPTRSSRRTNRTAAGVPSQFGARAHVASRACFGVAALVLAFSPRMPAIGQQTNVASQKPVVLSCQLERGQSFAVASAGPPPRLRSAPERLSGGSYRTRRAPAISDRNVCG